MFRGKVGRSEERLDVGMSGCSAGPKRDALKASVFEGRRGVVTNADLSAICVGYTQGPIISIMLR